MRDRWTKRARGARRAWGTRRTPRAPTRCVRAPWREPARAPRRGSRAVKCGRSRSERATLATRASRSDTLSHFSESPCSTKPARRERQRRREATSRGLHSASHTRRVHVGPLGASRGHPAPPQRHSQPSRVCRCGLNRRGSVRGVRGVQVRPRQLQPAHDARAHLRSRRHRRAHGRHVRRHRYAQHARRIRRQVIESRARTTRP